MSVLIAWAHVFAPKPVRESFVGFPRQIGSWSGKEGQLEPGPWDIKHLGLLHRRFYNGPKATPVNFFVAYYDSISKDSWNPFATGMPARQRLGVCFV